MLREKKKQEKEEEQRKKKALVAEKRAQAAEKRAQAAEKKRVQAEKKAQAAAKKAEKEADKASQPSRKRQTDDNVSTRSKLPRVNEGMVDSEAENVCCVCFQSYQGDLEDSDWLQCACNRWLHEDCITDVVLDVRGRELFCPYCCQ